MQLTKRTYQKSTLDYLNDQLNINPYEADELAQIFHDIVQANIKFIRKLDSFTEMVNCLNADVCFKLWIDETELLLQQSKSDLQQFAYQEITPEQLIHKHQILADRLKDLAERIYEGHWEYGVSRETDRQLDDLTELCRRIWIKESKAWLGLARVWSRH